MGFDKLEGVGLGANRTNSASYHFWRVMVGLELLIHSCLPEVATAWLVVMRAASNLLNLLVNKKSIIEGKLKGNTIFRLLNKF